jgi:glycosyltransferase involved in cell wall biosynthesis
MLLLEGTFPFVSGGVSSWVNQIIRGFPDLRFGICFIGSRRSDYGAPRYALPDNVVHLEAHFMHETNQAPPTRAQRGDRRAFELSLEMHWKFRVPYRAEGANLPLSEELHKVLPLMEEGQPLDEPAFLYSQAAWATITEQYRKFCTDPSFVDYFWTVRIMHMPLWLLHRVSRNLIPARCYHSVSTGYAGLLGALLKHRTGRPLILSEHGIYTKERKIDLFQSEWIHDNRGVFEKDPSQISYFRDVWMRFFEVLGRLCYEASDDIVALYEINRQRQIADGAAPEKTRNIPNGIDLPRLSKLRASRPASPPPVLCLIGRVVPIKDVKTFIRAMRTVVNLMPGAQGWIAGPEDEDPEYAQECRSIAQGLGLQDSVRFLGFQKIDELMPRIGLVVLSSISEALPLVLLEGFAAGVPAVATDVGSCRQLLYGLDEEDRSLGAAGAVVNIADPEMLARAAVGLLSDGARWHAAQAAGIARVERYYTQEMMFRQYRALYENALEKAAQVGHRMTCPAHR